MSKPAPTSASGRRDAPQIIERLQRETSKAEAIEALVSRLQLLPGPVRWMYAQQDVLLAIALGQRPLRGPRAARADRLVSVLSRLGFLRIPVAIATLALTAKLYFDQFAVTPDSAPEGPVFFGLGALRDPPLVRAFESRTGRRALVLDETEMSSLARQRRIPLGAILGEWAQVWSEIWSSVGRPQVDGFDPLNTASWLLMRLHKYAYCRAWLRRWRQTTGHEVVAFSAASYMSFGGAASGARTIYLPHGFQRKSLLLADFTEVHAFNRYEAEHFRSRLPAAAIFPVPLHAEPIPTERRAVITGDYWHETDFEACRPFIDWARAADIPVIIRPHPRDETGYWDRWRAVDGVTFDETPCDIDTFLQRHRPRFLVSWTSTTLFDAVMRGVVPITLAKDPDDMADYIVPLDGLALAWPECATKVAALADDPAACEVLTLARRKDLEFEPMPPRSMRA